MSIELFQKFGKIYKKGEIIFGEYEPGDSFFVIQEGKVKVTKIIENKEKTLDVFGPGDIFGEMAIIENQPRSATVEALTDVKVLVFNKENFKSLLQSNPIWGLKLFKSFSKRIYEAKRRVRLLLLNDPEIRILDTFCMLAECKNIGKNTFEPITFNETIESISQWAALDINKTRDILMNLNSQNKIILKQNEIVVKNINEFYRIVENKINLMLREEDIT
ncbi:MAG: Crp/Fnr family transcriptional regulator [Spirochaetes bacterium]|nr:Crp/Fnr family transcriptional regulator [Spirochaetota bacterium]